MLEVIMFAVALVFAQIVGWFILLALFTNEKFIGWYMKKVRKLMDALVNESLYFEDKIES